MKLNATVQAPAKINLALRVLGQRKDGFHELDMLNVCVDLKDEIRLSLGPSDLEDSIEVFGASQSQAEDKGLHSTKNLASRAARKVLDLVQIKQSIHIKLQKHIPSGAGLGGGSSDAAAVILCLRKYIPEVRALSKECLFDIAASLGSDVPYFLSAQICRVTGRGEVVEPVEIPVLEGLPCVLLSPDEHLSTATVFQHFRSSQRANRSLPDNEKVLFWESVSQGDSEGYRRLLSLFGNDLESSVCELSGVVGPLLDRLKRNSNFYCAVTGSGSSVFVLPAQIPLGQSSDQFFENVGAQCADLDFPLDILGTYIHSQSVGALGVQS